MDRRALGVALVVLLAAAAWVVAARPSWLPWAGDRGRGAGTGPSPAPADAEAAADDAGDAAATLAARGEAPEGAALAAGALPPPVDLAAADRDLDLHGTVVDGSGAAVAGADLVTLTYPFARASILSNERYDEAAEGPRTRSAKDGTFSVRLRRGAVVSLRVAAAGFAPFERPACHAGERVRIELRAGVSVVVEATTPEGSPAADVEFRLRRRGHRGTAAFRRAAVTGTDGRARFDDLPPGVSASLELGRAPWAWPEYSREVLLPAAGEAAVRVALVRGRTITGRVTDAETGAPIPDALVGMNWVLEHAVRSGADGRYELPGWTGVGIRDVHALAAGYGRERRVVGTATVVNFALSRGDAVVGRVVGPDRSPVGGAVVAAVGSVRREGEQTISNAAGTTSPDGRFSLAGLRRDLSHALVVMAEGFGRTLLDFDPRPGGPGEIDLGDVVLPAGRTILGHVREDGGAPVPDATIELRGANQDRGRLRRGAPPLEDTWYGSEEEATSASDGRFAFLDLAPGTYVIEAWTPGMPSREVTVKVEEDADPAPLEIRFVAGRRVRVTVVDEEGVPVPWAVLFVEGGSGPHNTVTRLDAAGSATLLLPDSVTSVAVETWGEGGGDARRFVDQYREFPVAAGAKEVTCVLRQGVAIAGRVVGPEGAGVAQAGVEIRKADEVVAWAMTDGEGRFEATVPREGPYAVRLDGSAGAWPTVVETGLGGLVEDVPGGATDVLVKAAPVPRDRTQAVLVSDPEGRPLAGARVVATWARQKGTSAEVATGADGRAEIGGLPDLLCVWKATPPPGGADLLTTHGSYSAPSSTVLRIQLRRGVRVRGRVVVPGDAAASRIHVLVMQERQGKGATVTAQDPTFSLLLDPEDGEGGSVTVSVGPEEAPTHVARVDVARFGGEEILLTPSPVR